MTPSCSPTPTWNPPAMDRARYNRRDPFGRTVHRIGGGVALGEVPVGPSAASAAARTPPLSAAGLVEAVRALKSRRQPAAAQLAALVPLLRTFVADPSNQAVPWPTAAAGSYGRLLLNDPGDDFQIIVASWPEGRRSPIHDHAGALGAVAALAGTTAETKYRVRESAGGSVRLTPAGLTRLSGNTVALLAPEDGLELHEMVHASGAPAATVHVYLTPLASFNVYEPLGGGRHRRTPQRLWLDAVRCAERWPAAGAGTAG